ncbi:MAG: glycosyltransferase family 39 protein [Rhodospirillaceae bacterium]|nr:glycosyltransferase family 39 protein [Rhodospirillaceae bacterium]
MSTFTPAKQTESVTAQQLSFAILGALIVLVLATFQDYGISWDEEVQNNYGEKLLALYSSFFADRSVFSYLNLWFYGGFFDLTTAIVNQFTPFDHFATRHLMGGLFGVVGFFGIWRLTKLLAGDWAALLAVAILASSPLLYGHMFINPKDAPFAWLTVWVLYYGGRALIEGERVTWQTILGLGVTLGLALGTRIMALAWLLSVLGAFAVGVAAEHVKQPKLWLPNFWTRVKPLWWAMPIALVLMSIFWPWSVTAPFNIGKAIKEFTNFPWAAPVLWDGEMVMSTDLPPDYLPMLLWVQMPELVWAGLAAACGLVGLRLRKHGVGFFTNPKTLATLLVTAAALLPIVACAVLDPTLYNGMRHFLFLVPLLGVLAAIGLERFLMWTWNHAKPVTAALVAVIAFGVGRQAWIAHDLHPNEYVYYNAFVGDLTGAEKLFELDYWGSSLKEASTAVFAVIDHAHTTPPGGWKVQVCGNPKSVMYFLPPDKAVLTWDRDVADFYVGLNVPSCRDAPIETGRVLLNVQRRGVTLSRAIDLRKPTSP